MTPDGFHIPILSAVQHQAPGAQAVSPTAVLMRVEGAPASPSPDPRLRNAELGSQQAWVPHW